MSEFKFFIKPGFRLNPDERVVRAIVRGVERCGGHCPCHNRYAGTEFDVCPCRAYREEDECCCTLYVKNQ